MADRRRRQGLDQARTARQSDAPCRYSVHRRRHGQHLPRRAGQEDRQVVLRDAARRTSRARSWPTPTAANCELVLPVDAVVAQKFDANTPSRVVDVDTSATSDMILDIGPARSREVVGAAGGVPHAGLEWSCRRFRDRALRHGHGGDRARSRRDLTKADSIQTHRRRRRHHRGAESGRRLRTTSPMSRRPAAPSSNGSKASCCRASRRCGSTRARA